jgi:hypothetical protein
MFFCEPESGVTILFNIVDNCEQCGQQNIAQSCFHQHCNNLIVFSRVDYFSDITFLIVLILTHPVNTPCWRTPEKTHDFRKNVRLTLFTWDRSEYRIHELRGERTGRRLLWRLHHRKVVHCLSCTKQNIEGAQCMTFSFCYGCKKLSL